MSDSVTLQLSGHATVFSVTPEAKDRFERYLGQARAALHGDPDRDEIVRDLEASIGDHLTVAGVEDGTPIALDRMEAVLSEIGAIPEYHEPDVEPRGRFFCRIRDGKWIGGVCLGLAAYGGFSVRWVRLAAVVAALFSLGVAVLLYLVLLLVLPEVPSVEEYERRRDTPLDGPPGWEDALSRRLDRRAD